MLTFLHLSDLHITTTDAATQFDRDVKIREAILADLGKEERTNFDAILVTGDIAYHGRADEFTRAKVWLEEVRAATGSPPEALFVVPGNHDVNHATVSKDSSLWELHQSLRRAMSDEDRLASLEKKLHDPFDFLAGLAEYRAFAAEYACPSNPKQLAWVQVLGDGHVLEDGTAVRFHGLNSALISDHEDLKANLILGEMQFSKFDAQANYVNVVLCHHPHGWLLDGNEANDFFRKQAHIVLCGHEHDARCYREDGSLRVFAGAVHPSRREASRWEPCYHVLRLSVSAKPKRVLSVSVETRAWRPKDKRFGPYVQSDGSPRHEAQIELPALPRPGTSAQPISHSPQGESSLILSASGKAMTAMLNNDAFTAARRKLIVHFFRLGTIARYEAVIDAGVWDESDDALDGQARWARVFDRAERAAKFPLLWKAVAARDDTLKDQPNPFDTQS
jgi:predicted phosphodiesterase